MNPPQPKQIAGCDVGSKENELQMEASACLAHEEVDLMRFWEDFLKGSGVLGCPRKLYSKWM